jgi:nucleoside 2-deoxyribosyltransferase
MLIYYAGPLFCQAELAFNASLTEKLEENGYSVFLPQRDGIEPTLDRYKDLSERELSKLIFDFDRNKILKADIFLMILDGRIPDEGACVELGIAHENKYLNNIEKLLIGFHTDMRSFAQQFRLNAMLYGPLDVVVDNIDDLMGEIDRYAMKNAP